MAIKVCHMTSAHNARDVRIFHKMCASLAEAGYETYLVAPGGSFEEKGVHVVGVGEKPASRMKRMTEMTKRVYEAARELDADIYHLHDPELLPKGLKLKKLGKHVIFDSHEFTVLNIRTKFWIPKIIRGIIAYAYDHYEAYICRRLDAVVAVCSINGQNYFEGKAKIVQYIKNYPLMSEINSFTPNNSIRFKNRIMCYTGSMARVRCTDILVELTEKTNSKLILAGQFATKEFEASLHSMPGWQNVQYLGFIGREDLIKLLGDTSVGVMINRDAGQYSIVDTLGVKAFEYMAASLPFVMVKTPYREKFIDKNRCGICVDSENVEDVAEAVNWLFDNPDKAYEMGLNGRKAILERYNWGVEEKKLLNLYNKILGDMTL